MKILTLSCSFGRDAITKLWLSYQAYLRRRIDLQTLVVCSNPRHLNMIARSGAYGVMHDNRPLGKKWNYGLSQAKELDWEYLQIMGSDDLLSTGAFKHYKEVDYQGFEDFYVFDSVSKKGAYWKGYAGARKGETVGAGRLIKREVIERCDWKLWKDSKEAGLDKSFTLHIEGKYNTFASHRLSDINECLLDIKSNQNIGHFYKYNNHIKDDVKDTIRKFYPTYAQRIFEVK